MKRTLSFMVMALALLLTQCRKPEVKFPTPSASEGVTVSMTVTAGPGSKTDITAAGAITWSEGDKLYVGFGGEYVGCLEIQSGVGTPTGWFSGTLTLDENVTGEQTFHFFYLGSTERTLEVGATEATVSFAEQNIYKNGDKLENASKHHVGYGSAKGTVAGSEVTGINVTLVSKVALACFSFTDGTTPYTGALTLSGDHIYNSMTVDFGGTFSGTKTGGGEISLTDATLSEKYVMLVPAGATGDVALSFGGGGKTGGATIEGGIQSNKFYGKTDAIPVTLTAPTPTHETVNFGTPDLNWSVCNLGATNGETAASWYGWYFMWGSVTEEGDPDCSWAKSPGNGGSEDYNETAFNTWKAANLTNNVLKPEVDAAHANWGEPWRMPTSAEWQSLYYNNTVEWLDAGKTSKKVPSFKAVAAGCLVVKGKEPSLDASVYMFLPALGYRWGTSLKEAGTLGYYWSSLADTSIGYYAWMMYVSNTGVAPASRNPLCSGYAVRPVR